MDDASIDPSMDDTRPWIISVQGFKWRWYMQCQYPINCISDVKGWMD